MRILQMTFTAQARSQPRLGITLDTPQTTSGHVYMQEVREPDFFVYET